MRHETGFAPAVRAIEIVAADGLAGGGSQGAFACTWAQTACPGCSACTAMRAEVSSLVGEVEAVIGIAERAAQASAATLQG